MADAVTPEAPDRYSVTRTVPVEAARLFAVLVDPGRHPELAGSGTLRGAVAAEPIRGAGDVFTMRMHEAPFGDYTVENHVVDYAPDRRLAWAPAGTGRDPVGHVWSWSLVPDGKSTIVTHSCDWSAVTDAAVRARVGYPRVSIEQMGVTIDNLVAAAS